MTTLNGQWIEAFRAGDYGAKGKFTTTDIDAMVSAYDPKQHQAPVVIGHPEDDKPAFGWVEALKREGDVLLAKLNQVQPEFEDLVRRGMFKMRSIGLYKQPKLGLRHVGFLGAMPPEVKGLAGLKLCEFGDGEFQEVEFKHEEDQVTAEEIKNYFSEALKGVFGDKPKVFDEAKVKEIATATAKEAVDAATTKFSDEIKKRDEKILALETSNASASTANLAEGAIKKLKDGGKWLPAFTEMKAPEIFAALASSPVKLTFGEGDKKTEKPVLQVFADFLEGLPKVVPAGEIAKGANAAKKGGKVLKFNETRNVELDEGSVLFAEAAEKRAAEKKISLGDAMQQLRSEGWQAPAGGATANAV